MHEKPHTPLLVALDFTATLFITKPTKCVTPCVKDVREAAGLGCPPGIFTTNASESINAMMKRKVDYKESEWPAFNQEVKQLAKQQ